MESSLGYDRDRYKVSGPKSVSHLKQTPIFEWLWLSVYLRTNVKMTCV